MQHGIAGIYGEDGTALVEKMLSVEEESSYCHGAAKSFPKASWKRNRKARKEIGPPRKRYRSYRHRSASGPLDSGAEIAAIQELGHQAVLIIGDYTAMVGDPTGRNKSVRN